MGSNKLLQFLEQPKKSAIYRCFRRFCFFPVIAVVFPVWLCPLAAEIQFAGPVAGQKRPKDWREKTTKKEKKKKNLS